MENTIRGNSNSNFGVSNAADGAISKASAGAHSAVDSIAGAADGAIRKAQPAIDQVATMAHQAVDKMAGAAVPTAEWLTAQGENLSATQKKLVADTCSYVSANPLKSLGIALATGFLLSRLIR